MKMWSVLFVIVFIIPVAFLYTFPEQLERCHLKDPNLDNCLKTAIEKAMRVIGETGIPSINMPPIEPFEAIKVEIGAGTKAVNLVQKYKDVKMYGYMNTTVSEAHLDMDKKVLTFTTHMPKLTQKAKYDVDGKIMMMPIYGSGDSTIDLYGVTLQNIITFKEEIRKHKRYFEIISYVVHVAIKNVHFDIQNLFNGNKELSDNVLKVVNENGVSLFEEVKEGIQNAYAEIYKNEAASLFHNVPVDEIFLP